MKKKLTIFGIAVGIFLSGGIRAFAAELATPWLPMLQNVDVVYCTFTNLSDQTVNVRVEWLDDQGNVRGSNLVSAFPQTTFQSGGETYNGARCVFKFSGSKKTARAHICIINSNNRGVCVARADAE